MSWPGGKHYSCSQQSFVGSLISRIHFSLFRTGGVLSHLNSSTDRLARFSPRDLCSLVTLPCNLCSIGRIANPSCSACEYPSQNPFHLILYCPATDFAQLVLSRLSLQPVVQALGELLASGAPRSSAMPPHP